MKKSLVWVVLAGIILTMNSCGDDEPEPVLPIVGTWARIEYEFIEVPTGYTKYWADYKTTSWDPAESGHSIVLNTDGTYSRSFTLPGRFNLNDAGTWTLDGTSFKLSPADPDDIDLIEELEASYGIYPGLEFSVEGEITATRMELTRVAVVYLPSDAAIDETPEGESVPNEAYLPTDVTIRYTFNRLSKP
jgi:hypothetical protein